MSEGYPPRSWIELAKLSFTHRLPERQVIEIELRHA